MDDKAHFKTTNPRNFIMTGGLLTSHASTTSNGSTTAYMDGFNPIITGGTIQFCSDYTETLTDFRSTSWTIDGSKFYMYGGTWKINAQHVGPQSGTMLSDSISDVNADCFINIEDQGSNNAAIQILDLGSAVSGDFIIAMYVGDWVGNSAFVMPAGWTQVVDLGSVLRLTKN